MYSNYKDTDDYGDNVYTLWLRTIFVVSILLLLATMILGVRNTWQLSTRQSSGTKSLIYLFYFFSLTAMFCECF